jgi:hypothetical protein
MNRIDFTKVSFLTRNRRTAFLIAGSAALLIALFTVSVESFKAATGDPVKALKNE